MTHSGPVNGVRSFGTIWKIVAALAVIAALGGGLVLLRSGDKAAPAAVAKDGKTPTGPRELAAADVATVELRTLARSLPLSGSLTPLVQTTVKAKV
ncbi:MAG TPA: hypothetical protein VFK72_05835, partial [Nevskia sp.]|nr:hypothetical protein [Nevskia sp.]